MYFKDITIKIKDKRRNKQIKTDGVDWRYIWPALTGDLAKGPRPNPARGMNLAKSSWRGVKCMVEQGGANSADEYPFWGNTWWRLCRELSNRGGVHVAKKRTSRGRECANQRSQSVEETPDRVLSHYDPI